MLKELLYKLESRHSRFAIYDRLTFQEQLTMKKTEHAASVLWRTMCSCVQYLA